MKRGVEGRDAREREEYAYIFCFLVSFCLFSRLFLSEELNALRFKLNWESDNSHPLPRGRLG